MRAVCNRKEDKDEEIHSPHPHGGKKSTGFDCRSTNQQDFGRASFAKVPAPKHCIAKITTPPKCRLWVAASHPDMWAWEASGENPWTNQAPFAGGGVKKRSCAHARNYPPPCAPIILHGKGGSPGRFTPQPQEGIPPAPPPQGSPLPPHTPLPPLPPTHSVAVGGASSQSFPPPSSNGASPALPPEQRGPHARPPPPPLGHASPATPAPSLPSARPLRRETPRLLAGGRAGLRGAPHELLWAAAGGREGRPGGRWAAGLGREGEASPVDGRPAQPGGGGEAGGRLAWSWLLGGGRQWGAAGRRGGRTSFIPAVP